MRAEIVFLVICRGRGWSKTLWGWRALWGREGPAGADGPPAAAGTSLGWIRTSDTEGWSWALSRRVAAARWRTEGLTPTNRRQRKSFWLKRGGERKPIWSWSVSAARPIERRAGSPTVARRLRLNSDPPGNWAPARWPSPRLQNWPSEPNPERPASREGRSLSGQQWGFARPLPTVSPTRCRTPDPRRSETVDSCVRRDGPVQETRCRLTGHSSLTWTKPDSRIHWTCCTCSGFSLQK